MYQAKWQKAKARFWYLMDKDRLSNPLTMQKTQIARIAREPDLVAKLSEDTFYDWFRNKNHANEIIVASTEDALKQLVEMVNRPVEEGDKTFTMATKLNAIKLLLDLSGIGKTQGTAQGEGKSIASMTEEEIDKLLAQHMPELATHQ